MFVVLLGAHRWPDYPGLDSESYLRSADRLRRYLSAQLEVPNSRFVDLFDDPSGPKEQLECLERRLDAAESVEHVLVFVVGHGTLDGNQQLRLPVRSTRPDELTHGALHFETLVRRIRDKSRQSSQLFILDCCYSGWGQSALAQYPRTALLASSSATSRSRQKGQAGCTPFSDGLLSFLESGSAAYSGRLSLEQVHAGTLELMRSRYRLPDGSARSDERDGSPPEPICMPELHRPNQNRPDPSSEDVARVPLFPNPAHEATADSSATIRWCIVASEPKVTGQSRELEETLQQFAERSRTEFKKLLERSLCPEPTRIRPEDVFESPLHFADAVRELCRAELAFFDLTGLQAGVLLLLGVRSVVRRGVTVCSYGSSPGEDPDGSADQGSPAMPFHLRDIQLRPHVSCEDVSNPLTSLRERAIAGLRERKLWGDQYEDLPGYQAVRSSPPASAFGLQPDYKTRALLLCPFQDYEDTFTELKSAWQDAVQNHHGDTELDRPEVVRTLDLDSPRLVSHTLCTEMRSTQVCLADWTGWLPNVLFEFGQRLAVHPMPPIPLISEKTSVEGLTQYQGLKDLFVPIEYSNPQDLFNACGAAVRRHIAARNAPVGHTSGNGGTGSSVHAVVTDSIDAEEEAAAQDVLTLLEREAKRVMAVKHSPVLFDDNPHLSEVAQRNAYERLVAGFCYVDAGEADAVSIERRRAYLDLFIEVLKKSNDERYQTLVEAARAQLDELSQEERDRRG